MEIGQDLNLIALNTSSSPTVLHTRNALRSVETENRSLVPYIHPLLQLRSVLVLCTSTSRTTCVIQFSSITPQLLQRAVNLGSLAKEPSLCLEVWAREEFAVKRAYIGGLVNFTRNQVMGDRQEESRLTLYCVEILYCGGWFY